jgi:hypothetical protein
MREQYAYRIRPIGYGRWEVYEYKGDKPIQTFNDPLEAAHWLRVLFGLPILVKKE